eukprot:1310381-Rhodomonas_salina.1
MSASGLLAIGTPGGHFFSLSSAVRRSAVICRVHLFRYRCTAHPSPRRMRGNMSERRGEASWLEVDRSGLCVHNGSLAHSTAWPSLLLLVLVPW